VIGVRRLLEISRDSRDIAEEAVVCHDERASGETGLNRDEHVMSVDGKGVSAERPQVQQLSAPAPGVHLREDTAMKEMALVEGEPVSVSHELQGRLPGVSPVEEITEIVRRVLKVCGFQPGIDDGSLLSKNE
jgi:hypothetical protein